MKDQCSGREMKFELRKTALQNKLRLNNYCSICKQTVTSDFIKFHAYFTVVRSRFWYSLKCLLALETTTNKQEVKRSMWRLQNMNNLFPKRIWKCLLTLPIAELFNFSGLVQESLAYIVPKAYFDELLVL